MTTKREPGRSKQPLQLLFVGTDEQSAVLQNFLRANEELATANVDHECALEQVPGRLTHKV